jgi:hypothetical protein
VSGFVSHSAFIVATWVAAVFGGIGIGAAFISAIIGYQLTEEALSDANTKISAARDEAKAIGDKAAADIATANKVIAEARAETAKANERTAGLEKAAAEATLEFERLRQRVGPRNMDKAKFLAALAGKERYPAPVQIYFEKGAPDGYATGEQIAEALTEAGWSAIVFPVPLKDESPLLKHRPIGYEKSRDGSRIESTGNGIVLVTGKTVLGSPKAREALLAAIMAGFGGGGLAHGGDPTLTPPFIALLIFARL